MEGWEDIVPVPQDDGPNPVVVIAYTPEYKMKMDIFRAILRKGELSDRVLNLTTELLDMNAANYTVWEYRRQCLYALGVDLRKELEYIDLFADDNPKNYQIWYHRRAVTEKLGDPTNELEFCTRVFEVDSKNYHAWAYRQWLLQTFGLWEDELDYIDQHLQIDARNNAAWNQRWFVIHNRHHSAVDSIQSSITEETVLQEVDYAFDWLNKSAFLNESAWNYLRGYARTYPNIRPVLLTRCLDLLAEDKPQCTYLLSLLAELWLYESTVDSFKKAADVFERLVVIDAIRAKYWRKRERSARERMDTSADTSASTVA